MSRPLTRALPHRRVPVRPAVTAALRGPVRAAVTLTFFGRFATLVC